MSELKKKNMGQSVFDRLKKLAKERNDKLNIVLERYLIERLLYRLSISSYRDKFILKGGSLLIALQNGEVYRVTRDADLLGYGQSELEHIESIFRKIFEMEIEDDGVIFILETLKIEEIKEDQEYPGIRVRIEAKVHNARQPIQIDIAFGDAVTPQPLEGKYPTLLPDMPPANLRMYPIYTVIAEKFEAMVKLGIRNSRMKDFYDIWLLSKLFEFNGKLLQSAIINTFKRRKTPFPSDIPFALTNEFYSDKSKITQWNGFLRRNQPNLLERDDITLNIIIEEIFDFLMPVIQAIQLDQSFALRWNEKQWLPVINNDTNNMAEPSS